MSLSTGERTLASPARETEVGKRQFDAGEMGISKAMPRLDDVLHDQLEPAFRAAMRGKPAQRIAATGAGYVPGFRDG